MTEGLTFAPSWTAIGWTYAAVVVLVITTIAIVNRSLRSTP